MTGTRTIRNAATARELEESLRLVQDVFTESENAHNALEVRRLVEETRAANLYVPELDLIMLEDDAVIGSAVFSRLRLTGDTHTILLLAPVAVRTDRQRRHVSKELIEYGFGKARAMGYPAVLVEGNPANYRSRGFVTAADFGILSGEGVQLPAPECLMVRELVDGALDGIRGQADYLHDAAIRDSVRCRC